MACGVQLCTNVKSISHLTADYDPNSGSKACA